MAESGS